MYIRAYQIAERTTLAAYFGGWHFAIADYGEQRVRSELKPTDMCRQAFDLSLDGSRLVTGHDARSRFRVWSAIDGAKLQDLGTPTAARVRFDSSAKYVLTWAFGRGKYVYSLSTGDYISLRGLGDLNGAYLEPGSNTLFAPIDRQSRVYSITFSPLTVSFLELPFKAGAYSLLRSPTHANVIVFYDNGRIECRTGVWGELLWARDHAEMDAVSGGSFSLDGRFIALSVVERWQVWVLDALSGELIHVVNKTGKGFSPNSPLPGSLVLSSCGKVLDAESGRISNGLNSREWWQNAGLSMNENECM